MKRVKNFYLIMFVLQLFAASFAWVSANVEFTKIDDQNFVGWLEVPQIYTDGKQEAVLIKVHENRLKSAPKFKLNTKVQVVKGDQFDFDYVGSKADHYISLEKPIKGLFYWREKKQYRPVYFHAQTNSYRLSWAEFKLDVGKFKKWKNGAFEKNKKNQDIIFRNQPYGAPTLQLAQDLAIVAARGKGPIISTSKEKDPVPQTLDEAIEEIKKKTEFKWFNKGKLLGWLKIADKVVKGKIYNQNSVLVRVNHSPVVTFPNNISYVDPTGLMLPRGLYFWDDADNKHITNYGGYVIKARPSVADNPARGYSRKNDGKLYGYRASDKKWYDQVFWDEGKNDVHPSQSWWGLKDKDLQSAPHIGSGVVRLVKRGNPEPTENYKQGYKQDQSFKSFFQKYQFFTLVTGIPEADFMRFVNQKFGPGQDRENVSTWKSDQRFQDNNGNSLKTPDGILYALHNDMRPRWIKNWNTNQFFDVGTFEFKTIQQLGLLNPSGMPGGGTFNVIAGTGTMHNPAAWFRKYVDVAALQAAPENNGAVFQLASNFHGLEARCNPEAAQKAQLKFDWAAQDIPYYDHQFNKKKLQNPRKFLREGLEEMALRAVQGEEAAISAAPGVIYKMYYHRAVNVLQNFMNGIVINGKNIFIPFDKTGKINYSQANFQGLPITNEDFINDSFMNSFAQQMYVACLKDVQVTGGLSNVFNDNQEKPQSKQGQRGWLYHTVRNPNSDGSVQRICQVFSSALDLDSGRIGARGYGGDGNKMRREILAQMILYPMYLGVLKAAKAYGRKKVFLTTIGTGSFKNDISFITSRYVFGRLMDYIKQSGLEVYLVVFDRAGGHQKVEKDILRYVEQTGGKYIVYQNDGKYELTTKTDAQLNMSPQAFAQQKKETVEKTGEVTFRGIQYSLDIKQYWNPESQAIDYNIKVKRQNKVKICEIDFHTAGKRLFFFNQQQYIIKAVLDLDYQQYLLLYNPQFNASQYYNPITKELYLSSNKPEDLQFTDVVLNRFLNIINPQKFPIQEPAGTAQTQTPSTSLATGVLGGLQKALPSLKGKLKSLAGRLNNLVGGKKVDFFRKTTKNEVYLTLVEGDVTEQKFLKPNRAAIVNAANGKLQGGSGIDAAVHKAALPKDKVYTKHPLKVDMASKKVAYNLGQKVSAGFAMLSAGFNLSPIRIIHAVGPSSVDPIALALAYKNSLYAAEKVSEQSYEIMTSGNKKYNIAGIYTAEDKKNSSSITQVAFTAISTGIFGYDVKAATPVAIKEVLKYFSDKKNSSTGITEVRFTTLGRYGVPANQKDYNYYYYKKTLDEMVAADNLEDITDDPSVASLKQVLESSKLTQAKAKKIDFVSDKAHDYPVKIYKLK